MIIKTLFFLYSLIYCNTLYTHGFGKDVFITLSNHYHQSIDNFCHSKIARNKSSSMAMYNEKTKELYPKRIKAVAKSKTNCYFKIGFDRNSSYADIICTPTQEFYSISKNQWIPAYQLQLHDELFGIHNKSVPITYIEFVNEPTRVFMLEVKETHTFFVGKHSILTHNMILPLHMSISIPFGGVSGGIADSCFGPITCATGIIAGSIVGTIFKLFTADHIPQYKLPHYDASYICEQRNNLSHIHDKNNNAQAPGKPTKNDECEEPKRWDGKK